MWEAHYDRSGRSGRKGIRYIETATAVALGSGIIQDHTHLVGAPPHAFDITHVLSKKRTALMHERDFSLF